MNADLPLSDATVRLLAATMIHFIWQGALVGAITWAALFVLDPRRARVRYAIHGCAMLAFLVLPALTLLAGSRVESTAIYPADARIQTTANPFPAPAIQSVESTAPQSYRARVSGWFDQGQVYLVGFWLVGTSLCLVRLILGLIGVWRLARTRQPLPAHVTETVDRLVASLGFRVRPAVYCSRRVTQAVALGVLKPMVLLPATWALELEPAMLEAVLAHELAHLRRWDLPINLLQRLVEALFFFHPAVWWCSRRMRIEREICCDEIALAATGNRVQYAEALTFLAGRTRGCEPVLAAGIGGSKMSLVERIRHVLGMSRRGQTPLYGPVCAIVGAAAASLAWAIIFYAARERPEASVQQPPIVPSGKSFGWSADQAPAAPAGRLPWPGGQGVDLAAKGTVVPSERHMVRLPDYTIGPPDILWVEALRVVPKAPQRIQTSDVVSVHLVGGFPTPPMGGGPNSDQYQVSSGGRIDLGPAYGDPGRVKIAGLTDEEAARAIEESLRAVLKQPQASVQLVQTSAMQPITGEHLVAPDGTVNLATYGRVSVAGLTLEEARAAIEKHLSETLDNPVVIVHVYSYNSQVYYVVTEGAELGDTVSRFPITGNETVLVALSQVSGLSQVQDKQIWIARPEPGGNRVAILPVNWKQITSAGATASNYQIFPGDRIFVSTTGAAQAVPAEVEASSLPGQRY